MVWRFCLDRASRDALEMADRLEPYLHGLAWFPESRIPLRDAKTQQIDLAVAAWCSGVGRA
jgi:hypothetical protein